ncbi:MAG: zinc ABC transporter substrate-binding protein [Kiritimatiellae bacterium]|nr:zinc ABC transporter substrate-binding protein [Kiritimatiellia bacterium]
MRMRCQILIGVAAAQLGLGAAGAEPVRVVTTIFPLADWARAVGGDRVEVKPLLPPGVEIHTYSPKPSEVLALHRAGVFIYLGDDLEPWAEDLLDGLPEPRPMVIEAGRGIPRLCGHEEHEAHDGHGHATDPHLWLDPVLAQDIVAAIAEGLAQADPEGRETYLARAAAYRVELQQLHEEIQAGLQTCRHRRILYAGHFAFGYFARRYGLEHVSPYAGFSPNAMPTPSQIAALIVLLRESGQKILFHEELLDPRVGRVIAGETGARLEVLHTAHNLTREQHERGGMTYLSIMRENLAKLRAALECP